MNFKSPIVYRISRELPRLTLPISCAILSIMPGKRRASVRSPDALLPQHEAFAQAVADGEYAVRAYKAHVAASGTTYSSCACEARQLLGVPEIAERVKQLRLSFRKTLEEKLGVTRETVAALLVKAAFTPAAEVERDSELVQGIEMTRYGEKIEFIDKMSAIEKLNKMAGWNAPEKVQAVVTSSESVALALEKHFARAKKVENGD